MDGAIGHVAEASFAQLDFISQPPHQPFRIQGQRGVEIGHRTGPRIPAANVGAEHQPTLAGRFEQQLLLCLSLHMGVIPQFARFLAEAALTYRFGRLGPEPHHAVLATHHAGVRGQTDNYASRWSRELVWQTMRPADLQMDSSQYNTIAVFSGIAPV